MILRGKKVIIKPLAEKHLPVCFRWVQDPEVTRFTRFPIPKNMKAEREWYREMRKRSQTNKLFAIHDENTNKYIGTIGLHKIDTKLNKNCFAGILIGEKSFWNRGYGTDAMKTILHYCFKTLKLHKVSLTVDPKNKRAIHCYKKAGFRQEGYLKDDNFYKGEWLDSILMAAFKK